MSTRTLCVVTAALLVGACATTGAGTDDSSPEQAYISDIERYAVDLGGFTFKVASRSDMIETGRTMCSFFDAGGSVYDVLLEVFSAYDTTADQPLTREETVLVTIYAITAAADNFCPEHRNTVDDFLAEDGSN